jgi:hypothetical protein
MGFADRAGLSEIQRTTPENTDAKQPAETLFHSRGVQVQIPPGQRPPLQPRISNDGAEIADGSNSHDVCVRRLLDQIVSTVIEHVF